MHAIASIDHQSDWSTSDAVLLNVQRQYRRFLGAWASDMLEVRRLGLHELTWRAPIEREQRAAA